MHLYSLIEASCVLNVCMPPATLCSVVPHECTSKVVAISTANLSMLSAVQFQGFTPLHWAVENGALACVGLLVSAGADSGVRTNVSARLCPRAHD